MKLTSTQLIMLAKAAWRNDSTIVIPDTLKQGAADKVVKPLIRGRLIEEIPAGPNAPAWRCEEDGGAFGLRITETGLNTIAADEGFRCSYGFCLGEAHAGKDRQEFQAGCLGRHVPSIQTSW